MSHSDRAVDEARAAWERLALAGSLPSAWLDAPDRRFVRVVAELCSQCHGRPVRGNEICRACEGGYERYDEIDLPHPATVRTCELAATIRARLEEDEVAARDAARQLARCLGADVAPDLIRWRFPFDRKIVEWPASLGALDAALATALGTPPALRDRDPWVGWTRASWRRGVTVVRRAFLDARAAGLGIAAAGDPLLTLSALAEHDVWFEGVNDAINLTTWFRPP